MANKPFSVLDEIDEPQDLEDAFDTSKFYGSNTVEEDTPSEPSDGIEKLEYTSPAESTIKAKKAKAWTPNPELMEGLPEQQTLGVVYDKGEIVESRGAPINGADEANMKDGNTKIADLQRQLRNIEEAKARHHIKYLQIPPGDLQTKFHIAAEDSDYQRSQATLDELLNLVETEYPYLIYARTDDYIAPVVEADADAPTVETPEEYRHDVPLTDEEMRSKDIVQVIINKIDADQIAWTEEESEKIRRSRTIELKIVESEDLQLGNIEDVEDDAIDSILSSYERTVNEVSAALPASHYRATFTGLTYAEIIDLSTAVEMNTYDGERKKWSIAFNHIKNQSIGPWEEYKMYKDPTSKKMVKTNMLSTIPPEVKSSEIHSVSKFEDFLRKTSFMDLEFILWKILCATTMGTELVTIKCKQCKHSYEHIYRPAEMLRVESIAQSTLDEIKEVATANTKDKIMDLYATSPVSNSNYVDLPNAGYKVIYGHASAYEFLNSIYGKIKELEDTEDPEILSKSYSVMMLPTIKAFLIPSGDGWKRITGINNITKVIDSLNEVDYHVLMEISRLSREPYTLEYSIPNVVCPVCKSKTDITIDNVATLLFIVARSLASVNITLSSN